MPHKANSAGDCINQQPEERQIILSNCEKPLIKTYQKVLKEAFNME